jgi:hypothetical protein
MKGLAISILLAITNFAFVSAFGCSAIKFSLRLAFLTPQNAKEKYELLGTKCKMKEAKQRVQEEEQRKGLEEKGRTLECHPLFLFNQHGNQQVLELEIAIRERRKQKQIPTQVNENQTSNASVSHLKNASCEAGPAPRSVQKQGAVTCTSDSQTTLKPMRTSAVDFLSKPSSTIVNNEFCTETASAPMRTSERDISNKTLLIIVNNTPMRTIKEKNEREVAMDENFPLSKEWQLDASSSSAQADTNTVDWLTKELSNPHFIPNPSESEGAASPSAVVNEGAVETAEIRMGSNEGEVNSKTMDSATIDQATADVLSNDADKAEKVNTLTPEELRDFLKCCPR